MAIRYAWPPEDTLPEAARAAARWARAHVEPAGARTDTLPASPWHFRPLRTAEGAAGVLGVQLQGESLRGDLVQTLDAMLDQAAVAIERLGFQQEASRVEAIAESEQLRSALLSSVSHDLRTPLTAILGSATALRRDAARLGPAEREDLAATIAEEAERLDRFVNNLLDVSRLEAGAMEIRREWLVVEEVVDSAVRRVQPRLAGRVLDRRVASGLPLLHADATLLETVLVNLLDNAAKHAPDATRVEIAASVEDGRLMLGVTDDGAGIPPEHQARLFDKFYRVQRGDRAAAGTGLGLSICKGLTEAMGGRIAVLSPVADGHGARFTVSFPVEAQPATALAAGTAS
jgi:two-component system sensor histidine kinase KdpD